MKVIVLCAFFGCAMSAAIDYCPRFLIRSKNETNIGRCNTYNKMDYDENREPKMIMTYICDPVCKCCTLSHTELFHASDKIQNDKELEEYKNASQNFQCVQKNTTIPVKYKNGTEQDYTFPSDCFCVKSGNCRTGRE